MIKAVIFDKDGVLLNLEATWLDSAIAMTHFVAELGAGQHDANTFQKIIGIDEKTRRIDPNGLFAAGSSDDQIREFVCFEPALEPFLYHDQKVRQQLRTIFMETHNATLNANGAVPNGDVISPVQTLHEAGYRLAVLTNDSEESARKSCHDIGILAYFDMIVGCDSGFGSKPEPSGFLAICQKFKIRPAQAVMVGDTYADLGAAQSAGAGLFVGISDRYPDCPNALKSIPFLLPDLTSLPSVLSAYADQSTKAFSSTK